MSEGGGRCPGKQSQRVRCEAWHTHNCAHGIYVLDGILQTHTGSFGPGSFVWFPQGMEMEHGATQDNDVTFLFIANKPLDIHYTQASQPEPAG